MAEYRFTFGDPPPCDATCPDPAEPTEPTPARKWNGPRGVPPGCYDEAPLPPPCDVPVCCAPVSCCCPAQVEKRNYITVKPNVGQTCLLLGMSRCTPDVVAAYNECIELRIRKRGECGVLLTMRPTSASLSGHACFTWDKDWWMLRDNWYEADVYVNDVTCLTVGLHQVGCDLALLSYMHQAQDGCVTPRACAAPIEEPLPVRNPMGTALCEDATC